MNPTNYRLIPLLTLFSKVFEKALYISLPEHFNSNKYLVGNLFVFRKVKATEDAVFKITNEILNAINNKAMTGSNIYDLEKAVDCSHIDYSLKLS